MRKTRQTRACRIARPRIFGGFCERVFYAHARILMRPRPAEFSAANFPRRFCVFVFSFLRFFQNVFCFFLAKFFARAKSGLCTKDYCKNVIFKTKTRIHNPKNPRLRICPRAKSFAFFPPRFCPRARAPTAPKRAAKFCVFSTP